MKTITYHQGKIEFKHLMWL